MASLATVFWDIGGVVLSNAWDRVARAAAVAEFGLDAREFEARHERVVLDFECGRLSIDDYLASVVFHRPRAFAPEAFRAFMCGRSTADPEVLPFVRGLARLNMPCTMASLNNESLELNRHRIHTYDLRDVFSVFFSSCYLGVAKPDEDIFRKALQITQRRPDECLFIDDRPANVAAARRLGIPSVRFTNLAELRPALLALGVETP